MITIMTYLKKYKCAFSLSFLVFILLLFLLSFQYQRIAFIKKSYLDTLVDYQLKNVSDELSATYKNLYIKFRTMKDVYLKMGKFLDTNLKTLHKIGYFYSLSVLDERGNVIFTFPLGARSQIGEDQLRRSLNSTTIIRSNGYAVSKYFIHLPDEKVVLPIYFFLNSNENNENKKIIIEGIVNYSKLIKLILKKREKKQHIRFYAIIDETGYHVSLSKDIHSPYRWTKKTSFVRHPITIFANPDPTFYPEFIKSEERITKILHIFIPLFFAIFIFILLRYRKKLRYNMALNKVLSELDKVLYTTEKKEEGIEKCCKIIKEGFSIDTVLIDEDITYNTKRTIVIYDIDKYEDKIRSLKSLKEKGIKAAMVFPIFSKNLYGFLIFGFKDRYTLFKEFIMAGEHISSKLAAHIEKILLTRKFIESERRYRQFIEEAPVGVSIIQTLPGEKEPVIRYVNPHLEKMLGWNREELLGKSHWFFVHPDDTPIVRDRAKRRLKGEDLPSSYEIRFLTKEKKVRHVIIYPIRTTYEGRTAVLTYMLDITERKEMEDEIVEKEKLGIVALFAGGFVHNLNNLLTVIRGYIDLFKIKNLDEKIKRYVSKIDEAVNEAQLIATNLLYITRKREYKIEDVNLKEIIDKIVSIFKIHKKDKKIEIVKELPEDKDVYIKADIGYLNQILLNIILNAIDAIKDEGKIVISGDYKGEFVEAKISDTGSGIPEEVMDHIFRPFFTTKKKGTGLGLYTVYKVIKDLGGDIKVESREGEGTTFYLYFPKGEKGGESAKEKKSKLIKAKDKKTILLVDDNEMVLDAGKEMLELLGYDVIAILDPEKVVDFYRENKDRIDLVILDMIMPKISGLDLYFKLKEIDKDAKIILSSGYATDEMRERLEKKGLSISLPKPFTLETLSSVIGELLKDR